jgi:hypothetical protein
MIPKSGRRFSEKMMLQQKIRAQSDFIGMDQALEAPTRAGTSITRSAGPYLAARIGASASFAARGSRPPAPRKGSLRDLFDHEFPPVEINGFAGPRAFD